MLIIEKEMGSTTIAANAIGMTLTQFINLRDGAPDSKTGVPRWMRKTTAWKIEDGARKERGWLDKDHSIDQRTNAKALSENMFNLTCHKCLKHTRKSFVELELYNEIACQCGNPIRVSDQYPASVSCIPASRSCSCCLCASSIRYSEASRTCPQSRCGTFPQRHGVIQGA